MTPQWSTAKPWFLIWHEMNMIDETTKKLPHMIDCIEQLACISFLMQQKKELVKIVLTLEEIITKKETEHLENNKMDGTDIPNGTTHGPPVHFSMPIDPILSTCNEMNEMIEKLKNSMASICNEMNEMIEKFEGKIDYIKKYASLDFFIDKKKKLAEIVITLEEIINKRQKEKLTITCS